MRESFSSYGIPGVGIYLEGAFLVILLNRFFVAEDIYIVL